jgi:hypothetical protein
MRTPTKPMKKRAGFVLLSVVTLVGTGTVAWGHGSPSSTIPAADGRVHVCFSNSTPRTLRVMQPTESCTASQSGFDFPSTGVLTQLSESAPISIAVPANGANSGVVSCAPKQAINVLFQSPLTTPVGLITMVRGGTPPGTELTVGLTSATGQTVSVRALCVESFSQ